MLAVGLVFLLDYLDDTVKSEAEILDTLDDVPVLAVVGMMSKADLKKSARMKTIQKTKVGDSPYATLNQ